MTQRSRPAAVASSTNIAGGPRAELIERSHQRSSAFGLTRIERPDYQPLMRGEMAVARERNQRLFTHAAPVMEMLFEQIVDTDNMIVLTDAHGTILHSVGDSGFLERARKVALAPGVNWAEHAKGTNAIGTALFEEAPTLVHGGEHYMHANHFLTCSAAPIFDPRGEILGVLDVSGDQRSFHQHTMGLVRVSARMIENHWLSDESSDRLRVHFHSRPEFIGTLLEGILVVGDGGRIVGANRSAQDQLGRSGAALRGHTLASLFDTTLAAISDHFRAPLPLPLRVRGSNGTQFHLHARANWRTRSLRTGDASALNALSVPMSVDAPARSAAATRGLSFLKTGDGQVSAAVDKLRRIIDRDIPLLLVGETGTGKELAARAMHQDSQRARQAFVAVNCATLSPAAIEAELFGAEPDAGERRKLSLGRIVQASGGTLFLDDIGALSPTLQARLLRVLQERCVTPLGSTRAIPVDVALVCASQRALRELIERGQFREDLYQRLNGLTVQLPPLRERSDLDVLAQRILDAERPDGAPAIGADVMDIFRRHPWPGNIRQLGNVLRAAAVMAEGVAHMTRAHLPDDFIDELNRPAPAAGPGRVPATMEAAQIDVVLDMLARVDGNISEASKRLGVSRNTIYRKLRKAKDQPPR